MAGREDLNVAKAEYDADPEQWESYGSTAGLRREYYAQGRRESNVEYPDGRKTTATEPVEEAEEPDDASTSSAGAEAAEEQAARTGSRRRSMHRLESAATLPDSNMEERIQDYLDRHPTAMKRIGEHRLQHSLTVGSRKTGTSAPIKLPEFGGGKPYPQPLPDREEYVVEFNGHDDPEHAQNWPMKTKIGISSILVFDALAATFASSIFSAASPQIESYWNVGREVATLGTTTFVLGYAFGPMLFAPLSELYGRRLPIIIGAFGFGIFNIAVAVAKDYQTLMISRFFAGVMGAAPLTIVAAVFADMYNNETRGVAVAVFSATIFNGPLMAPFIGGFIAKSYLGWRWTAYIPAFMGFVSCILSAFYQKESYGPVILVSKASELRRLTRNWGIHAKQEEVEVDLRELLSKNLSRPLRILFTEPIVLLITIYMSFIYGLLYLNLTAYGLVFGSVHGFSQGVSGLPYFGMMVGVMIGFVVIVLMNPPYVRKLKANNNVPVPEWRLPLSMLGGIIFAAGLFWFGWAGYKSSTHWIVPTLAGLFLGFGIYTIFLQCLNYIIDAYLMFAASAIAANAIMRSICGAVFPLFGYYIFDGIGIEWGMTLLGCVAALFIPMPFLFYYKGRSIRSRSKFAPALDIAQDKRRDEEARMGGDGETSDDGVENGASPSVKNAPTGASNGGSSQSEDNEKERKQD